MNEKKKAWKKVYYFNGKKVSKKDYDKIPDGPRKFYGFK
tara:strand:+ start:3247 stop:3363 length:117 start_codon:yes stop_codon:yes gene_type:complete